MIKRIRDRKNGVISKEHYGLGIGIGCIDQVFAVGQLCAKYQAKEKDEFRAFGNLKMTYDEVD